MPGFREEEPRDEGDDGEFWKGKGDDTKGEAEDGPEDGGLHLGEGEGVEVAAVAVVDGHDGEGDAGPLEELVGSQLDFLPSEKIRMRLWEYEDVRLKCRRSSRP